MLGDDWQTVRDRYIHTLGNLTLTGYNSELGDKPFSEKQDLLEESITHIAVLYNIIPKYYLGLSDSFFTFI